MKEPLSLHIKNDLREIEGMTQEIASWCRKQALLEELEFQIDLVLDELVSNVIRHETIRNISSMSACLAMTMS